MSRAKNQKKLHPAVLVLILLGSAGLAARSLFGLGTGPGGGSAGANEAMVEAPLDVDGPAAADATIQWRDLLVVHGSYEKGSAVHLAFKLPVDALAAAPSGEAQAGASEGDWEGHDPPSLHLGVVMISEQTRRAVLAGRVVGIGDQIAGATVTAITAGSLTAQWQGRRLTYDLDSDVPREFRAEAARRAERQNSNETAGDASETDHPAEKKEPGK